MAITVQDQSIEGVARILDSKWTASSASGLSSGFTSTNGDVILDAEPTRVGYLIANCDSAATLYLRHHATSNPSTTNYDVKLSPGQTFQMTNIIYTGVVRGIFSATPSGTARATRFY